MKTLESLSFVLFIVVTFYMRMYIHYGAQYLLLQAFGVPTWEFTPTAYTVTATTPGGRMAFRV